MNLSYTLGLLFLAFIFGCQSDNSKQQAEEVKTETELASEYLTKGADVTSHVFRTMSGKLTGAIKNGGVQHAIEFCNLNVLDLVDSLSSAHQVKIRRASHRWRNPSNSATTAEQLIIAKYMAAQDKGQIPVPEVALGANKVDYYAPILLMDACLKCHGKKDTDISAADYAVMSKYYPDDRAVGFGTGDLRGIWHLEFDR